MDASKTIDHQTLTRLVDAGVIHGATIIGQPGGWGVVVKYGVTTQTLAAKRGGARVWRRFETLVSYLKDLGLHHYQMDATSYSSEPLAGARRKRPDAAARMRRAHESAAREAATPKPAIPKPAIPRTAAPVAVIPEPVAPKTTIQQAPASEPPQALDHEVAARIAVAHEEWLRSQIEASRNDPRPSIVNQNVRAAFAKRRAAERTKPDQ